MGYISERTIREVNDRLDPVSLAGDYVRLEKRGGRYWGLCPFHNEKTPSFSVDPERKMYYCFGCHEGGGMISFLMAMDKLSFPEAVEVLAKRLGVEIAYENSGDQPREGEKNTRLEELIELYRRVAGTFHHLLLETPQGKPARDYILARGVQPELIDRFRLGYAPADRNWLFRFLSRKGYTESFLAQSGLFAKNKPWLSFFGERLMFPIADRQGRTVAFGGRILSGEGPKYLNSSESELYKKGETLFAIDLALPEIRRTREAYLAEGYMDVIALHQAGIGNAAAPLGTAFTDAQAKLLRRWAERLILVFDADEAGRNAAVKAILTCRRNGLACSVVVPEGGAGEEPPEFKDPAEVLKERGPGTLQKRVKCFIHDLEYLLIYSKVLYGASDSEGKAKAVAFLFPYVETLDSEVSREACLERIADTFRVEVQAVRDDYRHFDARRRPEPNRAPLPPEKPGSRQEPVRMNEELFLLVAVVVNPGFYPSLRAALSIEEFEDPNAKELFIALEEWYRNDAPGMDDLLSRISSGGLRNFVVERGSSEAFCVHPERLIADGIKRIIQKRLERRRAEIVLELRSTRNEETGSRSEDLLSEKVYIDTELHRFKDSNK